MVEAPGVIVGLDQRDGRCHLAGVEQQTGRAEIKALVSVESEQVASHQLLGGGCIVYAVPDELVMVKKISLGDITPDLADSAARFELAQSLLEDEREFYFDIISTGSGNQFLGTITRRQRANQLITAVLPGDPNHARVDKKRYPFTCRARAVALGKGYLAFCHRDAGELICLADFTEHLVSVCFVRHNNLVGLDRLKISGFDLSTDTGIGRMAVEFKTMVNFKLTSLFDNGVTVPLAALLINHDPGSRVAEALSVYFPNIIGVPRINTGFFSDPSVADTTHLPDYLVALGLTVK